MKRIYLSILMAGLVFLSATAVAMPPVGSELPTDNQVRDWDSDVYINAANILMFVTNRGGFGRDLDGIFGYGAGAFYPFTSTADIESGLNINTMLWAAGLWVGGKVNGQVRVSIAEYNEEYVPGPMLYGTHQDDNEDFLVYKIYSDSTGNNANWDYEEWPYWQGAPVDGFNDPVMLGDQTLWTVFNDADTSRHQNNAGQTDPLGIEIQQTIWAYGADDLQNIIFMRYKLYNKGANLIEDAYISLWADPDLGHWSDDFVGCDTLNDLFFCYNADNDDAGHYGSTPPALGFKFLSGPVVPSPGDTADFDGVPMPGFKNLPMTSFQKYINGTDPNNATESYNYMKGLSADGSPLPNGTNYAVPGDPVAGTGDLDFDPSDRRMMGTCGPITMMPGDSQYIFIKMAVGQGPDRLTSITNLRELLAAPTPSQPALKATVEPDPLSMIMLNAIDPIEAVVTFGYDADGPRGREFRYGLFSLDGLPPIDSTVILPSYPGFNGEVIRFFFPLTDLLTPYHPLWDSSQHSYSIWSLYADGLQFLFETDVTIHGHRSGDLNLDGQVDISDLVFMVDYFFNGGPAPELLETADLDQSGVSDITDLIIMIDMMFGQ